MSYNDRCGEALAILEHGGVLPDHPDVRDAVMQWLEQGQEGYQFPPRGLVQAILQAPENADLAKHAVDGGWEE